MASPARHLFLVVLVAVLAVAAEAWGGGRFFFSKTTRAEAAVEPEKAAADLNAAPAFSRPSTGGSGRGYGLYGRPEENYPPDYFRRGVHRNAEKLTTTDVPAAAGAGREAVPVGGEHAQEYPADGSGRGRPPTTVPPTTSDAEEEEAPAGGELAQEYPADGSGRGRPPATTSDAEEEVAPAGGAGGDLEGVQPYPEDGSGRGRPPWYYTAFRGGRQQRGHGMSGDTRLYQNGRYYYDDVDARRYGYGRESNPVRTRPEEEFPAGSGYGRPAGGDDDRRGRYGNAAAGYRRYGGNDDDEFGNGAMDQNSNGNGFQEEKGRQNGGYIP